AINCGRRRVRRSERFRVGAPPSGETESSSEVFVRWSVFRFNSRLTLGMVIVRSASNVKEDGLSDFESFPKAGPFSLWAFRYSSGELQGKGYRSNLFPSK